MTCQREDDLWRNTTRFAYIEYIAKCRSLRLEASQTLILWSAVLQVVYICGANISGITYSPVSVYP